MLLMLEAIIAGYFARVSPCYSLASTYAFHSFLGSSRCFRFSRWLYRSATLHPQQTYSGRFLGSMWLKVGFVCCRVSFKYNARYKCGSLFSSLLPHKLRGFHENFTNHRYLIISNSMGHQYSSVIYLHLEPENLLPNCRSSHFPLSLDFNVFLIPNLPHCS